jgi:1-deoxy-D-xylulose-5-phosphate reductoisomerase
MGSRVSNVAILGSTGSIGCSTLEVISACPDRMATYAITAHSRIRELVAQAHRHRPRWLVATDPDQAESVSQWQLPPGTRLLVGEEGVEQIARDPEVAIVVAAIVGSAGLRGTWAAI